MFYTYCKNSVYGLDESSTMREEDEAQRQIDGLVGSMDDKQVSSFLAQADALKHGRIARMAPAKTRQKILALLTDSLRRLSDDNQGSPNK